MTKRLSAIRLLPLLFLPLLFSACRDKGEIMQFAVSADWNNLSASSDNKTILHMNEHVLMWETDDDIWVYDGSNGSNCTLITGANDSVSYFKNDDELVSGTPIYAIYPASSKVDDACSQITFPATQPYRGASDLYADSSFGRGAMPMVCYESHGLPHKLYFHCVGGLTRLQFFSTSATTYTIESIQFKEVSATPKQISGTFNVGGITENEPWLTATTASPSDEQRTITITGINQPIGGSENIWYFYLPLPAVGVAPDPGNTKTTYRLEVTVNFAGGYHVTKTMSTDIRRLNIQMMPAIDVTNPETGTTSHLTLVGSGTYDRPFQIYTFDELLRVRNAFNSAYSANPSNPVVKVNGITVTENTYFKIVRSDITLTDDWNRGIDNFVGHMYFASSTATQGGITNTTDNPLFESIASTGHVNRLYTKGTFSASLGGDYSPFCRVNNGEIVECHNQVNVTNTNAIAVNVAGLCLTNNGTIKGGANEGILSNANGNVAGICFNNYGTIQGNFTLSSAVPVGKNIAGIAYNNYANAVVRNCNVSINTKVSATGNWGCVVYDNKANAVILNCATSGAAVFSTNGSIGGIAHTNAGTIGGCTNGINITGGADQVGGIVALQAAATALIYNCSSADDRIINGTNGGNIATDAGGIAGRVEDGYLLNCYSSSNVSGATNSGGIVGFFANDAKIDNCWTGLLGASTLKFSGGHADGALLGYNCYSDYPADYQCSVYANTTEGGVQKFKISSVRGDVATVSGYNYLTVGTDLMDALNNWLNGTFDHRFADATLPSAIPEVASSELNYYSWRHYGASSDRPVFNTGAKGKK